ncbi:phosphoribosyltransferase-like protein [Paenibacillus abyssi]|uniref:PRTase-CE domain-containing protein n=1 Tax=Paenibacillus abyssi TaxID=1340531 RepID=A0A917FX30_9BACL|nr:hypothetical protein [Paenibacillus abyssi]GGG09667.1 hypothetical protein GCM10010916_28190 [Paenibacillus abyssi]
MSDNDNIDKIVAVLSDFRRGEITPIDYEHVVEWINQFDLDDRSTILNEVAHILNNNYLSRANAKKFMKIIINDERICGDIEENYENVHFLQIDQNGSSQKDLLTLVDEVLNEEYEISIQDCGTEPTKYVYIDDCIYSGNTAFNDLKTWIEEDGRNTELHVVFSAAYSRGLASLQRRLRPIAIQNNTKIKYWRAHEYNNFVQDYKKYECCWPVEEDDYASDRHVDNYVAAINERAATSQYPPRLYRDKAEIQETLFTSSSGRNVVEKAFFKWGAYITSLPKNAKQTMRPLGYEFFDSLGFGALFVTYRNISNNCPLVLWWGDKNMPSSHPFSNWHPLIPRKVNDGNSYFDDDDEEYDEFW